MSTCMHETTSSYPILPTNLGVKKAVLQGTDHSGHVPGHPLIAQRQVSVKLLL